MESEWRKFRSLVPVLRERYIAKLNTAIRRKLGDQEKTETGRFWDALKKMEKEARILESCLDDHSRSRMWLYMLRMREARMLEPEDLAGFSPELQKQVFPDESEKGS